MYGIIYKITNTVDGKIYIGQTVRSFWERYEGHLENTKNRHLKRAIQKYGVDAFEIVEVLDAAETKEELDAKEQYYIALYRSNERQYGYNIADGGHRGKQADETRKLIGDAQRGEKNHMYGKRGKDNPRYCRTALVCANCGKPIEVLRSDLTRSKYHFCSPECAQSSNIQRKPQEKKQVQVTCDYCGKVFEKRPSELLGKKNLYCSRKCQNEHQKIILKGASNPNYGNHKVSGGNNGRAKKVLCVTTGEVFDSAIEAGQKYGIKRGLIPACCRGNQKTAGGKEWKYL